METQHLDRIRAYFETHNRGDEAAHMALIHHDVRYYGSVFGREAEGLASYKGIFRSAHRDLGIRFHRPVKVFGIWPEVAVLVEVHWAPPRDGMVEAIWRLGYGPEGLIRSIAILWDPRGATLL